MIFSFLFSYDSYPRPRSKAKRSARTQTNMLLLTVTDNKHGRKEGRLIGPQVQFTPLSPKFRVISSPASDLFE